MSYLLLYRHKGLVITQWCQIPFLLTSVVGWWKWMRALERGPQAVVVAAEVADVAGEVS